MVKRLQIAALCLIFGLMLAGAVPAQKIGVRPPAGDRASSIAAAERAMDREAWPEAEAILRKLVAANAKDALAWFDLGYVMHAQKNYAEAITAYRGAVAAQPQSFECNLNLGLMLAHEGRPEASKYLEAATRLKPTGEHPGQSLANAWSALAEVEEHDAPDAALAAWAHAVELAPDVQNHLGYGTALEKAGKSAEAEAELRKAGALDPKSSDAMAALASFYMRGKRLPEAEQTLTRLVAIAPSDENAHLQLGRVLGAEGKNAEAAVELRKAVELRPADWDALRDLALVQEHGKQYEDAAQSYRRLIAQFPEDSDAHNGLGTVLLAQHLYAEAERELLVCVRLKPEWGEAYGQLALAASGNKDYELAIKALDARRKLLPELPSSYFLRATCYDHLRRFAEAVENYKAFLAIADGKFPNEEWEARHRLIAIEPEVKKKR